MKIKQSEKATEQDISYINSELYALFNDLSETLEQNEARAQNNMEIHSYSINADFDGLKRQADKEHNKKWNKGRVVAGIASVVGLVGLIAAGTITQNPTFFSPGNLILVGSAPILSQGLVNYFSAFSLKHNERLKDIEDERQARLDNVPFSPQALHDQKEIEVNKAWLDAVESELGLNNIDTKNLEALAKRRRLKEGSHSL